MKGKPIAQGCQLQKPMGVLNKLKLLKKRRAKVPVDHHTEQKQQYANMQFANDPNNYRQRQSSQESAEPVDWETQEIQQRIADIEQQLPAPSVTSSKKYALNKSLKMEKSKIIRR